MGAACRPLERFLTVMSCVSRDATLLMGELSRVFLASGAYAPFGVL